MSEIEPVVEPIVEPVVETIVEPVVEPVVEPKAESIPIAEIEKAATAQGWDTEKGELSALEFLANGRIYRDRMYDEIKDLRSENEKIYGLVAEGFDKQERKEHANEVKSIQEQIDEAEEAGDATLVKKLFLQLPPAPVQKPVNDPNTKFVETWMGENKWFDPGATAGENAEMTRKAQLLLNAAAITDNGQFPRSQIPEMEKEIRRLFPDHFKAPANPNADRGADVEKGSKKPKKGAKKGLSRADLDEEEGLHFDDFIKGGMKEETLLASIQRRRDSRG